MRIRGLPEAPGRDARAHITPAVLTLQAGAPPTENKVLPTQYLDAYDTKL